MSLGRFLTDHLRPYRRDLVLIGIAQVSQTAAGLLLPSLSARLIDDGVLVGDQRMIWRLGALMLAIATVQLALAAVAMWFGSVASLGFGRDVRRALIRRVMSFSTHDVSTFGAPSLITRITNDVQQVQLLLVMVTTMMIIAPLTIVIGSVLAIRQAAEFWWILAIAIPIEIAILVAIVMPMVPQFQRLQDGVDRVNTVLREQIAGMRVIRAFTREPEEIERFSDANAELTDASMRSARLLAATFPAATLIANLASVVALWAGASRVSSGNLDIGSLVAFLSYVLQVLMAVVIATFMLSMIPRASVAATRIDAVLQTSPSVRPPARPSTPSTLSLSQRFDHVGFRHTGAERSVLTDVTFETSQGRTTAIVGSTGAGKTTLLALAARLADVSDGSISFDGIDLRDIEPSWLRTSIGYVPQRAQLFSGTVATNLHFAYPDATDADLWAALEVAQADTFVRRLPGGLDAEVTQGGTNFSGGQRQRLSIARALVARPRVLLLDDAFSALDVATEARLRTGLRDWARDSIVLQVAQRVATIRDVEQIVVLDRGEVVGAGSYDSLLHTCPTFAEIVDSQQRGTAA